MREANTSVVHTDEYIELLNFKKEIKKNSMLKNSNCASDFFEYVSKDKAFIEIKKRIEEKDAEIKNLKEQIEKQKKEIKALSESISARRIIELEKSITNKDTANGLLLFYIRDLLLTSRWSLNKFRNEVKANKYIQDLLIESGKHEGIYKIY